MIEKIKFLVAYSAYLLALLLAFPWLLKFAEQYMLWVMK